MRAGLLRYKDMAKGFDDLAIFFGEEPGIDVSQLVYEFTNQFQVKSKLFLITLTKIIQAILHSKKNSHHKIYNRY